FTCEREALLKRDRNSCARHFTYLRMREARVPTPRSPSTSEPSNPPLQISINRTHFSLALESLVTASIPAKNACLSVSFMMSPTLQLCSVVQDNDCDRPGSLQAWKTSSMSS